MDRVADLLTRIRNAQKARLPSFTCPASNLLADLCTVLEKEGYIRSHRIIENGAKRDMEVQLKYHEGEPVIQKIQRVSKGGQRKYSGAKDLPRYFNGLGIAVVSTSKGVMSDYEARQQNVGGEVLCAVF